MDPEVKYLLSLGAVRDRAKLVGEAAAAGKLSNFDVHEERLGGVAEYVTSVIKVCHLCNTQSQQVQKAYKTVYSEISAPTNSTPSPHTADGSTSKSATYLA
jgi:hypothetical protein